MPTTTHTAETFAAFLAERGYGGDAYRTINRWLARGDGAAVYQNQDMGSHELGQVQIVSYGSETAQLETDEPPVRLPDLGSVINWRYQLLGAYRGAEIEVPA